MSPDHIVMSLAKDLKQITVSKITEEASEEVKTELSEGDIIVELNGTKIQNLKNIKDKSADAFKALLSHKSNTGKSHCQFKLFRHNKRYLTLLQQK